MMVSDRAVFLHALWTRPLVLVRHVPCLVAAVLLKIGNRLRSALAPAHVGAKRRPYWIYKQTANKTGLAVEGDRMVLPDLGIGSTSAAADGRMPASPGIAPGADDAEARFERNRWRFLCEWLLGDRTDRQQSLGYVRSWIAQNTDRNSEAWEPYSASERVANLLVFLACDGRGNGAPPDSIRDLKLFVRESLDWIAGHLEYYGEHGTNNHILNNARALVMGGVAVGDEQSVATGIRTFREFLPRLITKDGFLRERSSHYQWIVANWVLDAWRFVDAGLGAHNPDVAFLQGHAMRMTAAATMLADDNGELLGLIGDISPDASPQLTARRLSLLYPDQFHACARPRTGAARIADDWFRLEGGCHTVLGNFPAGTFPPKYPTHGHADHTGFVWRSGEVPVLVDSGRYRYTPDAVSVMQKSALGHSVALVNGFPPVCDSMLQNGLWWPWPYARAKLSLNTDGSGVSMAHDGYARATPVNRHVRKIEIAGDGIQVVDTFEGSGTVTIRQRWNFGPDFDAFDAQRSIVTGQDGAVHVSIAGFSADPEFRVFREDNSGGWYSDKYAAKAGSLTLVVQGELALPVSIRTNFEMIHVWNSRNYPI